MVVLIIKLPILEYWKVAKSSGLSKVCWYWRLARAFIVGDEIFIMRWASNSVTLLAHELGHWHGLEHTLKCTIMNPCGFLRWAIAPEEKGLIEEAEKMIKAG